MKKKTYDKPLIRVVQLESQRFLLNASSNGQTEEINEQREWEHQEGGWSWEHQEGGWS